MIILGWAFLGIATLVNAYVALWALRNYREHDEDERAQLARLRFEARINGISDRALAERRRVLNRLFHEDTARHRREAGR